MKVIIVDDEMSLETTGEELTELQTLIGHCCDKNISMDLLYEMISEQLRPKLVIKINVHTPP